MKKKVGWLTAVAVMAIITVLGCGSTPEKGDQSSTAREARRAVSTDIYNDEPNGILEIQNNTKVPLVLFAGSISNQSMLGGVRANSPRTFDIFDDLPAGSNHGTFLLRAVQESVYTAKGSSLEENDVIYAALVTYDRNNPRPIKRIIQESLGGNAQVIINNDSDMVLEIRLNRRDAAPITTLGPWERDKVIYLEPNTRGYTYFPVWQFYDKASGGIRSIQPAGLDDTYQMAPVIPGGNRTVPRLPFALNNTDSIFTPFATLIVRNESRNGIFFQQGTNPLTSQGGMEIINPGDETFELDLNRQPVLVIGGYTIDIGRGVSNYIPVPEFRYEAGYNYVLRLRADGTLAPIERVSKMDITGDLRINLDNEN
jgi:hypothetical protein